MRYPAILAVVAMAAAPGAASAQTCAQDIDELDRQIKGAALQEEYRGREEAHPLVLKMQDGELVDLTGQIVTAKPYESWTGNRPVVDKVGGHLTEGRASAEAGKEQDCMSRLEIARQEISRFSEEPDAASGSEEGEASAASDTSETAETEAGTDAN